MKMQFDSDQPRTPLFSEVPETSSIFDKVEESLEDKIYNNDMWRKSIEQRRNGPLTINEYEIWYEIAANCEMMSELQYINYVHEFNNNKGSRQIDEGKTYEETPEVTLNFPTLMCTSEQMLTKLAATTEECNKLKKENAHYKELLGNFCVNYAYSPERKTVPNDPLECPRKPTRRRRDKTVSFDISNATPKNLFPVKSLHHNIKLASPVHDDDPRKLRRQYSLSKYIISDRYRKEPRKEPFPRFVKASDLMKRVEEPIIGLTDVEGEMEA